MALPNILFVFIFVVPIIIGVFISRHSKKLGLTFISIPFIFMLGVALWWLYETNHRFVGSSDLAGEQIENIKLHMLVDESFKQTHGDYDKPENVRYREFLVFENYAVGTDFQKNEVVYIETEEADIPTTKGITVGDDLDRVIEVYGDKNYQSNETGQGRTINFVDRDNKIHLQFWLSDGKVVKIALYSL